MGRLLGSSGISPSTTVVLYGDNNNWFATYAFWQMKMYGHQDLKIMDGGRQKWIDEGKATTTEPPVIAAADYSVTGYDAGLRATREDVLKAVAAGVADLVDVRAPAEYSGELLAPANLPQEGSQRGGHIPGAANIPWASAVNDADGTFKSADQLRWIYGDQDIKGDRDTIAYCRIGERSSRTWFVLTQILGYSNVSNYDGSWTEYGSIVGAPIER
jgi:thiosulfate/3-mercaptopyruvate sulfurtransferase